MIIRHQYKGKHHLHQIADILMARYACHRIIILILILILGYGTKNILTLEAWS
jgi:hypothetical protein